MKFNYPSKEIKFLYTICFMFIILHSKVICISHDIYANARSMQGILGQANKHNAMNNLYKFFKYKNAGSNNASIKDDSLLINSNNILNSLISNSPSNINKTSEDAEDKLNTNPDDIVKLNNINEKTNKIDIDLKQNDPLKFMRIKEDLVNLYLNRNSRFKQVKEDPYDPKNNPIILPPQPVDFLTTKPSNIGKNGDPVSKEYHSDEEVVKIIKVEATSIYRDIKNNRQEFYYPDRILSNGEKFWCSEGNHDFFQEVKFYITFPKSFRLNAMWIHWAFAPAEYKLSYSNEEIRTDATLFELITNGYQSTIKNADLNWWKSILSNSKTRWKYKSFDQRIDFDEPIWARILEISMRIPVNQYYGIYKLEFYTKSREVVMIKSKMAGEELCLTVVNGQSTNSSPVVALDCLQAISYGDNRDLFVLNSNGYITTFMDGKCLESSATNRVDILDCGISSQYKDEREKWIMEYDGKIRSTKEEFTCLSVSDLSVVDEIPSEDMRVSASSTQSDGLHDANKAISEDITNYWASDPSLGDVIFEIYFHKYSYIARDMTITWKFPAKMFKIIGLFPDGYWKVFKKTKSNRDESSYVNLMNKDLMGIKIVMLESTTKIEDKNVYGIKNIAIHTGSRYLRRDPCKDILLDANKFELISVGVLDKVTGADYKRSKASLHQTRTKLKSVETMYQTVPDSIIRMKEVSTNINQKLSFLSNSFSDLKNRLNLFSEFLAMENLKIFTLAANEYFPAIDCAHIIKAFPSKRSGMYWIKNECMPKAIQVYCDFDSYENKGGLDYYIFNDNQPINTPFKTKFRNYLDIRYKCNVLGLEPLEIKNDKMLSIVYNLLKILKYDLNSDTIIPLAYDYNCDVSKCANLFKPFNDINSGDISDLLSAFIKNNGLDINYLFNSGINNDPSSIKNIAAFGRLNNIIYDKLDSSKIAAIVCSTNKDGKKTSKNYIDVDCDGHLRTEAFTSYEIFSNLRMICPSDCSKIKAPVYGTGVYTDNSSVCRAAIHSGAILDSDGGIVEVRVEPGKKNYIGTTKHNIESLDNPSPWDRSFTVQKYNPYCPIDKMKEYTEPNNVDASSFLELGDDSSSVDLYTKSNQNPSDLINQLILNMKNKEQNNNKNKNINENTFNSNEVLNEEDNSNKIKSEMDYLKSLIFDKKISNKNIYENDVSHYKGNFSKALFNVKRSVGPNNQYKLINDIIQNMNYNNNNDEDHQRSIDNFMSMLDKKTEEIDYKNFQSQYIKNTEDEKPTNQANREEDKNAKLINAFKKIISLSENSRSNKNEIHKQVLQKLGQLSRFLEEDLSNTMKFNETNQNKNNAGNNLEMTEQATTSANVGPEILDKIQTASPSNDIVSNKNYIDKIAKNLHSNALKTNVNRQNPNMQMEIIKRLLEYTSDDNEINKYKQVLGFSIPSSGSNTGQALSYINASFTKEENNLKQIKKVADDFKMLIGKAISEIGLLNSDKDFGIDPQKLKLKEFVKKTSDISKILFEIEKKIQNKIRRTEYRLKIAKYLLNRFMIRKEFTETYQKDIFKIYDVFNSKKGKGKPAKWEYYPYNIGGHSKVIKQENAFMDNRSGSNLILNDRDYYDFELKCSFFLKDNNTFGMAFRYVDPYNYYIFEVSNLEKGYKRIRKFVKGVPKVIDFKNDGGFFQETWYNVKIRAQQSKINIYMTNSTGENMDKLYELQFSINDNEIVHGTIAFTSFGMNFMLLDNISVVPIQCTNFDDADREQMNAITPTCPRFYENFKNGFSERWKIVDPKEYTDGPSEWVLENDYEYREKVLKQTSYIYGTSDDQEGSLYVMKDSLKECNIGKFSVKFNALDNGIVGFVFRFEKAFDEGYNYYIIEVSGNPEDKFIRMRKRVNNQFTLVSVNPLLGYKKNTWMRLSLTLNVDKFNVFISEVATPDKVIKVFPKNIVDSDLKYGTVGLSSYKTRLIMEEISLSPYDNLDDFDPDKTLYVNPELLDCKILFK